MTFKTTKMKILHITPSSNGYEEVELKYRNTLLEEQNKILKDRSK